MNIVRKSVILGFVIAISACTSSVYITQTETYLCDSQLVIVEYLSDNAIVAEVGSEKIFLNSCNNHCRYCYQDITENTKFWFQNNQYHLKIGQKTYSECKNLF